MGKRTHDRLLADGARFVSHIAGAIRKADGDRVTITSMAKELNLSRRALKHNLEVWAKEQRHGDLASNSDWRIVEHWLANLQTPVEKRKAYAALMREVITNAADYDIRSFTDVAKVLQLPRAAAEDWYTAFGGADRPMIDGRHDSERRLYSLASALGDHQRIEVYRMADLMRLQEARERLAPRVEEIEGVAA